MALLSRSTRRRGPQHACLLPTLLMLLLLSLPLSAAAPSFLRGGVPPAAAHSASASASASESESESESESNRDIHTRRRIDELQISSAPPLTQAPPGLTLHKRLAAAMIFDDEQVRVCLCLYMYMYAVCVCVCF